MRIKSFLAKPLAVIMHKRLQKSMHTAVEDQSNILKYLMKNGAKTRFGIDHKFTEVSSVTDYQQAVPIRDYEGIKPYIEQIIDGKLDVLWKGKPLYFAKTSGTTSGVKLIPISKDSISNHIDSARNALLTYMINSKNTAFADGKMIFLSGSPVLERIAGIPTGRLSGISNHHVPSYLRKNQCPTYATNCIEDWETKLGKIVEETIGQDMTLVSGIPPWIQMYFDWILEKKGVSTVKEIFPHLQVLVHGGVNFEPYKQKLIETVGYNIDTIETFPASEGFFAFQDTLAYEGLLLNTNSGIFYEFIPVEELGKEEPKRLSLGEVELGKNYALIINSNAGLWGYSIGDTVKFVSIDPYRIVVTGRIKHFISAFGEHVIAEEVEDAISHATQKHGVNVVEFTVAPVIQVESGLPYHEWLIEFEQMPENLNEFAQTIDQRLCEKNIYYRDLIVGKILQPLKITCIRRDGFKDYMKSIGKLGGQNKSPRLTNDRTFADALLPWKI